MPATDNRRKERRGTPTSAIGRDCPRLPKRKAILESALTFPVPAHQLREPQWIGRPRPRLRNGSMCRADPDGLPLESFPDQPDGCRTVRACDGAVETRVAATRIAQSRAEH